jgi:hypothetical protein
MEEGMPAPSPAGQKRRSPAGEKRKLEGKRRGKNLPNNFFRQSQNSYSPVKQKIGGTALFPCGTKDFFKS